MVTFSQLRGSSVFDKNNKQIGVLSDLVFVDGTKYAEITHLIYEWHDKYKKKIPWSLVGEFKEGKDKKIEIILNETDEQISPFFVKEKEMLVGGITDKQVVDVDGVKVVRVNDVALGKIEDKLCIVAVAVGAKSLARRLGFKALSANLKENVIPWKSIERVEAEFHGLHLKIQKNKIAELHSEDIADLMEDLSQKERILIFNSLPRKKAVKTLIGAEPDVKNSLFRDMKTERIKDLLENIPLDQSADILSFMSESRANEILGLMRKEDASKIRKVLNYHPESAGAIMDTMFIAVPKNFNAEQTIRMLRKKKPSSSKAYHIYVVDKANKLMGVLSIRDIIISPPKKKVVDFMKKEVIFIKDTTPKEDIAKAMTRYDVLVLPVVDQNNVIKGVVTADDVLTEFIPKTWRREKYRPNKIKRR